jgi:hypothetical protein
MVTPGTVERVLLTLLGQVPTGVIVALLVVLVAHRITPILQQVAATWVALFSNNPQRADRALCVLCALRGVTDVRQMGGTPRIGGKRGGSVPTRRTRQRSNRGV